MPPLRQKDVQSFLPQRMIIRHWSNNRKGKLLSHCSRLRCLCMQIWRNDILHYGRTVWQDLLVLMAPRLVYRKTNSRHLPSFAIWSCPRAPLWPIAMKLKLCQVCGSSKGYIEDRGKHRLVLSVDVIQQAMATTVKSGEIRWIRTSELHNWEQRRGLFGQLEFD